MSSDQSSSSPEPEVSLKQAQKLKEKSKKKDKSVVVQTPHGKNEGTNPDWAYKPPEGSVLVDGEIDEAYWANANNAPLAGNDDADNVHGDYDANFFQDDNLPFPAGVGAEDDDDELDDPEAEIQDDIDELDEMAEDDVDLFREGFERDYLRGLLERCEGNISRASREAGIDRVYLRKLLRKHGLEDRGGDGA